MQKLQDLQCLFVDIDFLNQEIPAYLPESTMPEQLEDGKVIKEAYQIPVSLVWDIKKQDKEKAVIELMYHRVKGNGIAKSYDTADIPDKDLFLKMYTFIEPYRLSEYLSDKGVEDYIKANFIEEEL